jgi:CBS domain-containing protein
VPVNADGFVAGSEESVRAQRRQVFLKEARAEADAGRPRGISVRNLLALWGAQARGLRINLRIEADLANHGLVTAPSFRKVTLDATVDLIGSAASESAAQHVESVPTEEADDLDVGLTVGNLPSALGGVVSVPPEASFDEAITLMLLNDYSQLAVLSGKRTLRGAVTWKSIARLRHLNPSATLANTIVHVAPVRYDQDLIEILSALESQDFVLVRDGHNAISGIVTTADVVAVYGQLSTPFFLIGQLDQSLRRVMSRYFRLDEIRRRCDTDGTGRIESFDDLTMGDYLRVLENQECWAKLNWPLHRSAFVKRLDELREIRNEIMHFNPDPLPADAVDKLRNILRVLRECVG